MNLAVLVSVSFFALNSLDHNQDEAQQATSSATPDDLTETAATQATVTKAPVIEKRVIGPIDDILQLDPSDEEISAIEDAIAAEEQTADAEINADESADHLNSLQQLEQTYTLTRKINGTVESTEKKTVVFSRGEPVKTTEAGESQREKLAAAFDGEVLTRKEAFEEAKLYFTLADRDRNGQMTTDEFIVLAAIWRENNADENAATDIDDPHYAQSEPHSDTQKPIDVSARRKFSFMAGAATSIDQKKYISEYLVDFDAMDANSDMLLKDDEISNFRAENRGDTVRMPSISEPPSSTETDQ